MGRVGGSVQPGWPTVPGEGGTEQRIGSGAGVHGALDTPPEFQPSSAGPYHIVTLVHFLPQEALLKINTGNIKVKESKKCIKHKAASNFFSDICMHPPNNLSKDYFLWSG